ncbi:ABC transporter B family member 26, chloroplastic [Aristolochia californica]|uniref:ABC transporter B family member 26, chloroplastic n=1 Tax=Aristolochia californica TaxID=171875 RepID=UPI0035DE2513
MVSRLLSVDPSLMSSSLKTQRLPLISIPIQISYPHHSRLNFSHSLLSNNVFRGSVLFSLYSNRRPRRLPSSPGTVSAFSFADSGVSSEKSNGFLERVRMGISVLRSVLPGGSWWKLSDWEEGQGENRATAVTVSFALRRMWDLVAKDRWIIYIGFVSVFLAAVSEISVPHFLAASIFSAQSGETAIFLRNSRLLALLCLSSGIFSGLRGCCFGIANMILVKRMREMLYSAVLFQDISFFDSETVGDLTSRLGADCQQVSRVIGNDLQFIARNVFQGTGALIFLFTLSWRLALSTLAICSVLVIIMFFYGKYQKQAAKLTQEYSACATEVAQETLSLIRTVRVYGTEMQESRRYQQWLKKLADLGLRQSLAFGLWISSFNFLYHSSRVTAVLVGGVSIMAGRITAEQLTKFILYCEWLIYATWWVGDSWSNLMQSVGASEKVFQLMDLLPSEQFLSEGLKLEQLKGHIEFVNVSYHYASRNAVPVLQNINISIQPNEVVAIVGLSGSGKSTLVNLLLRLYEPTEGQIFIDGYPLGELDVQWLREKIGFVRQEPRLFRMDVESNIKYGCPKEVDHEDVVLAAKQAFAHDFILSFPNGYGTLVDNDLLSGGQKQRIAIARALLRDPSILIFDEATSALDAESEHFVKEVLTGVGNGSSRKRTVIIIAHRLSTIQAADRIVLMEGGRIVEMGSHSQLIHQDGAYARLTKRQTDGLLALQN